MDSLSDAKELIKKLHPKSDAKIDWENHCLVSEFGIIELLPGGQWVLNGTEIKTSQLRKTLGCRPCDIPKKELFLEKLAETIKGTAPSEVPKPVVQSHIVPVPFKKPRKKRAPMSPEQRQRAIQALKAARVAKQAKKVLENKLSEGIFE